MYKNMVKMIFVSIMSLIMAQTAFALGGGGASSTEPGDSCEAAGSDPLKRAAGAPYSGNLMVWFVGITTGGNFEYATAGNLTQFGSECVAAINTGFVTDDPTLFDSFSGQDLRKLCLQNVEITAGCAGSDSGFMEVITGKNPQTVGDAKTVDVIVTPLRNEF